MKKIGIIGGLGPEATGDYYKEIINRYNQLQPNANFNYPEIIIYSANLGKLIGHMEKKEFSLAIEYLSNCIHRLQDAGADFGAISANTPHQLFDEIQGKCKLPLISIVKAVKNEAIRIKAKRTGLIGTKFTMKADFYACEFAKSEIEVIVPQQSDIDIINHLLFSEMELGIFKAETREILLRIIERMQKEHNIDSLILGCTEFPIMFTQESYLGIPFLNTTRIHVDAILKECLS